MTTKKSYNIRYIQQMSRYSPVLLCEEVKINPCKSVLVSILVRKIRPPLIWRHELLLFTRCRHRRPVPRTRVSLMTKNWRKKYVLIVCNTNQILWYRFQKFLTVKFLRYERRYEKVKALFGEMLYKLKWFIGCPVYLVHHLTPIFC